MEFFKTRLNNMIHNEDLDSMREEFDTFSFEVNEKGLPIIVGDLYDPLK